MERKFSLAHRQTWQSIVRYLPAFFPRVLTRLDATDMVEKLAASGSKVKIVRLGHPARVLPGAMSHTLDDVYRDSNSFDVVKGIVEDMDKLQKDINRARTFAEKRGKRAEWNQLRKDLKTREVSGLHQIISEADVVLCTCTGAQEKNLKRMSALFGARTT